MLLMSANQALSGNHQRSTIVNIPNFTQGLYINDLLIEMTLLFVSVWMCVSLCRQGHTDMTLNVINRRLSCHEIQNVAFKGIGSN